MRHFVAYHNAEKMGYDYEPGGEYTLDTFNICYKA
jgi:hypothetical protein